MRDSFRAFHHEHQQQKQQNSRNEDSRCETLAKAFDTVSLHSLHTLNLPRRNTLQGGSHRTRRKEHGVWYYVVVVGGEVCEMRVIKDKQSLARGKASANRNRH